MKTTQLRFIKVTTSHPDIGFTDNVLIIETALREKFGLSDCSGLLRTLAEHVWSSLCMNNAYSYDDKTYSWATADVIKALERINERITQMTHELTTAFVEE